MICLRKKGKRLRGEIGILSGSRANMGNGFVQIVLFPEKQGTAGGKKRLTWRREVFIIKIRNSKGAADCRQFQEHLFLGLSVDGSLTHL